MSEEQKSLDQFDQNPSGQPSEKRETSLGRIPAEWEVRSLGAGFSVEYGDEKPEKELRSDGYPVYGANGIIGYGDEYLFDEPVVAITCRGATCGNVHLTESQSWITNNSLVLTNGGGENKRFLLDALRHHSVERAISGSAQPQITATMLSKMDYLSPPLPEQRKIATVLYTVDRAIEKTEEVIKQVRTIKQGILQDLINGVGSDPPLEEKRVGPRVVSLPEDWEVVQIGDALEREIIFEQQDGNHGSDYPRKDEFVDEGIPYISAEMLSEGEVDFSQAKYLTEERASQLRIGFAKDGDVLLAHNATVGPAALLETNLDSVIIGTSLTYYRCNPDKLDSQYLTYFFQSGTFQKQLQDVMRQSTRNQVPITRQRNLHLILPPIQQQREISNQIDSVNEKLRTEKRFQERLQRLKHGLMQDLLSGTVRMTDTNIEVPEEVAQYG